MFEITINNSQFPLTFWRKYQNIHRLILLAWLEAYLPKWTRPKVGSWAMDILSVIPFCFLRLYAFFKKFHKDFFLLKKHNKEKLDKKSKAWNQLLCAFWYIERSSLTDVNDWALEEQRHIDTMTCCFCC